MIYRLSKPMQYLVSFLTIAVVSLVCYALAGYVHYRVLAFILLLFVSLIAVLFDIVPVLISACFTALVWDYFFIPPRFTLQVGSTEDRILLLMYFVVAIVSAVLTYKIRQIEKTNQEEEGKANTIRLYNTLLNSLSHELRTPIATIIGATDNLQNNNARLTPVNRFELLAEISKASLRLNQQVENLLNMSRLESGFVQPKEDWCDVNELIYDVVKTVEENKPGQRISISINPDIPLFRLDKGLLQPVLYNIISNATIYTPASSKIVVSANCHTDVLEIKIEDNGPGFPEAEMGLVFDKFYRLKNTSVGGTGLGLSIVKGFTEALGGSINLENLPNGGAAFTILIKAQTSYLKNLKNE